MTILRLDEALAHHGDSCLEVEMLTSESLPSSAVRDHVVHNQIPSSRALQAAQHPMSPFMTL